MANFSQDFSQKIPRWIALFLCGVLLTACSKVAPWERGNLAKPQMALDLHPMQNAMRSHLQSSREAALGGHAATGGGCGCY